MPELRKCLGCGADVPANAPFGHCPRCLLELGFSSDPAEAPDQPVESAEPQSPGSAVVKGNVGTESTPEAGPGEAAAISEKPGDRVGRYKLLEKIGEGGCGVVYMAEQEEPVRRRVALKVIKLGMDTKEVIARFEAERQALALMEHPNIAKIFDGGATDTGRPYFVMELVRGIRITEYCDQKSLSTRQRLDLFMQICQAVQHAHQKGIIHRDLKPSNILVTVNDGLPVPKVIDFGIAKATGQRLTDKTLFTKFQQLIGTPAYMSPEQAEMTSADIDTRSDIYSLGVLLYELLTGRTPFDTKELLRAGVEQMLRTIREQEPARPSKRLSTLAAADQTTTARQRQTDPPKLIRLLRGDLDWMVMKALEKNRARRYETANGLAMDVQRHLNNEPVLAGPPTAAYRLRKLIRKYRAAASIAAAFLILLTLATGLSLWLAARANQERASAVRAEGEAKSARGEAEQEARRRLDLLNEMQLQRAEDLFAADDSARAVAHLANVLTSDPSNRAATERLLSALTVRDFTLPLTQPIRHQSRVRSALFSPDGLLLVTAWSDVARVWDAQTGKPLTEPLRHKGDVNSAQFSPDGLRVITVSGIAVRIWDTRTGNPLTDPMPHRSPVRSAQFSPDGLRVVTASRDKTAQVWNAETGKPLTDALRHEQEVLFAQFSPDGLRVVTASSDQTARIWDAQTGEPLTQPLRHEAGVLAAQFRPDGLHVVTVSAGGAARVWDTHTGKPLTQSLWHQSPCSSAQISPDGLRVVTSWRNVAQVLDAETGSPLTQALRHEADVYSVQFSRDGLRVVTACKDKAVRVWDAQTGKPLAQPMRHESAVYCAQFSPDGLRVVTGSERGTAWVCDVHIQKALAEPLGHESAVYSAQFSPDGLRVVTASEDKTARVWDVLTGKPLTEPLRHSDEVQSVRVSPDGLRLVTASKDKTARVWDAQTGEPLTEPLRHEAEVHFAQFSPDGLRVVTVSGDTRTTANHAAQVWDARTGKPLTRTLRHEDAILAAQFSRDGLRLITASSDKVLSVWDAWTGKLLTKSAPREGRVSSAQFSPDGLQVVTATFDQSSKTAWLRDARTGKRLTEPLRHDGPVWSAQFSPDGLRVVTASEDKTARVWEAKNGKPLSEPLRHEDAVLYAEFSPDGQRVVTASWDKTARVWDAQTGKPLSEPLRHEDAVLYAQFSSDGLRVVTASRDKTARVWEVMLVPGPAPPWLPELAVIMAGKRLSDTGFLDPVAPTEFLKLKEQWSTAPATNFYTRWAKWFCADRATRRISPLSSITVPEYVQRRIEENTPESLREAISLCPTNGLAFARLARQVLAQDPRDNRRRFGEADFFSRLATDLSPHDPEVQRVRAEILDRIKATPKP